MKVDLERPAKGTLAIIIVDHERGMTWRVIDESRLEEPEELGRDLVRQIRGDGP